MTAGAAADEKDIVRTDIAIIGGGLAGLNAARLLHREGADFRLVEARDRLGGRILTVDAAGAPADDGFDLGPSWVWPALQPAVADLIAELGLPTFFQNDAGDVAFERMSRETVHRYPAVEKEPQSVRLVGGTAALVRALAADLPGDRLSLGTRVAAMTLTDGAIRLALVAPDGSGSEIAAGQVIAALPPRLLEATVAFAPAVDPATAAQWRDTPTWMAPHAKVLAVYDRPFWREAGFSGTAQSMVGPLVEVHDATTASGQPALFGFPGLGPEQRRALGEEALIRAGLAQFARLFGPEAEWPRATLCKDWASDPFTAAPADWTAAGHAAGTGPRIAGAWGRRLVLCGSESSPTEPGYLAGAIEASRLAAAEVIERLAVGAARD